jgi:lipopolysaccharide transport system ATP-binding protein
MNIAIRAEHVAKEYRLGVINHGMLYKDAQSWLARRLGRPDPHAPIGKEHFADQTDRFWALKDLNFEIEQGDRVGIIGRNGAGKSTLLKILSRITAPTEGSIKLRGRVTSLLEVGTGFHGELTGRENIFLNGAILGMKQAEVRRKLDEIIAFSEIEQYIDTPVKRYSSGMYVRLAFAVAAHLDSEILLADEVLAVGDAAFQKKALGKMNELSTGQGRTVLFVSHNMSAVATLCRRGMLLDKGAMAMFGPLDRVIGEYNSEKKASFTQWSGSVGDEHLSLTKFQLLNRDGTTGAKNSYRRGEPVVASIRYKIHIQGLDYVLALEFFNAAGEKVCTSCATDSMTTEEHRKCTAAGEHELRLAFRSSDFAPGEYSVRPDFGIYAQKGIVVGTPSLVFEVVRGDPILHEADSRKGIMNPDWSWELDAV